MEELFRAEGREVLGLAEAVAFDVLFHLVLDVGHVLIQFEDVGKTIVLEGGGRAQYPFRDRVDAVVGDERIRVDYLFFDLKGWVGSSLPATVLP